METVRIRRAGKRKPKAAWSSNTTVVDAVARTGIRTAQASTAAKIINARAQPQVHGAPSKSRVSTSSSPLSSGSVNYKFEVDVGDHCETPLDAYEDIDAVLTVLCKFLKKSKAELAIYDPYFCQGSMVAHLASVGYTNVYNRNEDFYKLLEAGSLPKHDVLLTNPPYSGNHMQLLLTHVAHSTKPSLLLVPSYVHTESYFSPIISKAKQPPMFLLPWRRYAYWSPAGIRGRAMPVTPFESVWQLYCGKLATKFEVIWNSEMKRLTQNRLFISQQQLEANSSAQVCRTEKRPNPKARKRARQKLLSARGGD